LDGGGGNDTIDAARGGDVCLNGHVYLGCENQDDSLILPPPPDDELPSP
jgi:hypothetical protein